MKLKKYNIITISYITAYFIQSSIGIPTPFSDAPNKILYIMLDGFRYDYVEMQAPKNLPGFTKFLREGIKADWMTPIFPSVSFPDWTTLVTGLWAESHGIVGNRMYDPINNDLFLVGQPNITRQKKWWKSEPIWTTATKAGLKAGIVRWSRCEVPFDGILPKYCDHFDHTEYDIHSFGVNSNKALNLLESGYDLVMLYTPYIDTVGHYDGPDTEDMIKSVQLVDKTILHILNELESRHLDDKVNIIIVSDHGMKNIAGIAEYISLVDFIDVTQIDKIVEYGAFCNIKTQPGVAEQVFNDLKNITGLDVYMKKDIPTRLHYKNHEYIHDILVIANDGFYIQALEGPKQIPQPSNIPFELIAAHGFDPLEEKMRAIFFAKGPDFKEHKIIPAIQIVDVYPLLAHLLKIDPLPNNGTLIHTKEALK